MVTRHYSSLQKLYETNTFYSAKTQLPHIRYNLFRERILVQNRS